MAESDAPTVDELESAFKEAKSHLEAVTQRLMALTRIEESRGAEHKTIKEAISALTACTEEIRDATSGLSEALEAAVDVTSKSVDAIRATGATEIRAGIRRLDSGVRELRSDVGSLAGQFESFRKELMATSRESRTAIHDAEAARIREAQLRSRIDALEEALGEKRLRKLGLVE